MEPVNNTTSIVTSSADDMKAQSSQGANAAENSEYNKLLPSIQLVLMIVFGVNSDEYKKSLGEYLNEKANTNEAQKNNLSDQMDQLTGKITPENATQMTNELGKLQTELGLTTSDFNTIVSSQADSLAKATSADQSMAKTGLRNWNDQADAGHYKNN